MKASGLVGDGGTRLPDFAGDLVAEATGGAVESIAGLMEGQNWQGNRYAFRA